MNNKIKAGLILVSVIGFLSGVVYLSNMYPFQTIIILGIIVGALFSYFLWESIYKELENK
jgi:cyanate permease